MNQVASHLASRRTLAVVQDGRFLLEAGRGSEAINKRKERIIFGTGHLLLGEKAAGKHFYHVDCLFFL